MPKLYIISGCNGSGKTTASYTLLPELLECQEFVNSDEFAKSLSPFDPSEASVTASRFMLMKIKYLMQQMSDFGIETTLATRALKGIINQARELGYSVTILYFWLSSPELAIKRVRERVETGGHNIPDDVVRRRYYMGLQYFFEYYPALCDKWVICDSSMSPFAVIAEGGKGTDTTIRDLAKYDTVRELYYTAKKLGGNL